MFYGGDRSYFEIGWIQSAQAAGNYNITRFGFCFSGQVLKLYEPLVGKFNISGNYAGIPCYFIGGSRIGARFRQAADFCIR